MAGSRLLIDEAFKQFDESCDGIGSSATIMEFTNAFIEDIQSNELERKLCAVDSLCLKLSKYPRSLTLVDSISWYIYGPLLCCLEDNDEKFQKLCLQLLGWVHQAVGPREIQVMVLEQLPGHTDIRILNIMAEALTKGICSIPVSRQFTIMRSSLKSVLNKIWRLVNFDDEKGENVLDKQMPLVSAAVKFSVSVARPLFKNFSSITEDNFNCIFQVMSFLFWSIEILNNYTDYPVIDEIINLILTNGLFDIGYMLEYPTKEASGMRENSKIRQLPCDLEEQYDLSTWSSRGLALFGSRLSCLDSSLSLSGLPKVWTNLYRWKVLYPLAMILLDSSDRLDLNKGLQVLIDAIRGLNEKKDQLRCVSGTDKLDELLKNPHMLHYPFVLKLFLNALSQIENTQLRAEGRKSAIIITKISFPKREKLGSLLGLLEICPVQNIQGFLIDLIRGEVQQAQLKKTKNDSFRSCKIGTLMWSQLERMSEVSKAVADSEDLSGPSKFLFEGLDVFLATSALWHYVLVQEYSETTHQVSNSKDALSISINLWDNANRTTKFALKHVIQISAGAQKSLQFWLNSTTDVPQDFFKIELLCEAMENFAMLLNRVTPIGL